MASNELHTIRLAERQTNLHFRVDVHEQVKPLGIPMGLSASKAVPTLERFLIMQSIAAVPAKTAESSSRVWQAASTILLDDDMGSFYIVLLEQRAESLEGLPA